MKHFKLLLATLLAIVSASSMKALEPADLAGNYLWKYKNGDTELENSISIAVDGEKLVISNMFDEPLQATLQQNGDDAYLVIAKGQQCTTPTGYKYEVQGSTDMYNNWGTTDIKGKIGTGRVITFDYYLRALVVEGAMAGYTVGSICSNGSTLTPLSELPSVVELPTGAIVKDYQLAYNDENSKRKTKAVGVAIVGNDVYVKGFLDYLPEAWVKGTKVDNNWVFPANQYLGKYSYYDCYYFCNGETTFTYDSERPAYKAYDTEVFGKGAGVQTAYYYEPELSEEFDTQAYAVISSDGENMTFCYDKDYLYAKAKEGDSFSHVYLISFPWANYCPAWSDELETIKKIKTVSFDDSFKDYQPLDLYRFFDGMNNLTTIEGLKYLDTLKAQHTALMFQNCFLLESLDLSSFNTEGITNGTMSHMFYGCKKLKSITFGEHFKTGGVTNMQNMFGGCESLESLDVSNFDTQNVTNMQNMFYGCSKLTSLDVSNFNTQNVKYMDDMFRNCSSLESLDVSSFSIGNVIQMYDMFYGCSSLETIYCAEGTDWSTNDAKKSNMFYGCSKLSGKYGSKEFEFNGTADGTYAKVYLGTALGGYFTSIKEKPEPYAVLSSDGKTLTFYYDNQKGEKTGTVYLIPWIGTSPGWYESHNTITTATFDESFKDYDGLTTTRNMFNLCGNLETINHLEYLNTENVTDMCNMFWYCGKLTTLDVSNFNTAKVTNMCNMFSDCKSLKMLDLGDNFNTAKVTDMSSMFNACISLETIYCNDDWETMNENLITLKSDMMFYGCTSLKGASSYVNNSSSDDVSMANPSTGYFTARQPYAVLSKDGKTLTFYYDENKLLTELNVYDIPWGSRPNWANRNETITTVTFDESFKNYHGLTSARTMFTDLENLKTINHLEYLDTENVETMRWMFNGCSSLETLDLSNFNTKNVTTMNGMFYGCSSLKNLDLSGFNTKNVTDMSTMFNDCSSLETIYCKEGTVWNVTSSTDMFHGCENLSGKYGSRVFKYDPEKTNVDYARALDETNEGYFTSSSLREAYAVLTDNEDGEGKTLTFYYDAKKPTEGTVYDIPWDENGNPLWSFSSSTTVTFDESFKDYDELTSTKNMFYGMFSLQTINNLEYLNTKNVTDMTGMFQMCNGLTSLNLGDNFDTSSVTDMTGMFKLCYSLTSLDLGDNFNTENVTNMYQMFYDLYSLTSLDLGDNFDTSKVTDMREMFYYCKALETIYCKEGTDWSTNSADKTNMFAFCTKLSGKCGSKSFECDGENDIDGTYAKVCTDDQNGYFTSITEKQAYAVLSEDGETLTFYYDASRAARQAEAGETNVFDVAWNENEGEYYPTWNLSVRMVTAVEFTESFGNYHGLTRTSYMFEKMPNLKTINGIEYLNTENVTDMKWMFYGCSKLTSLELGDNFDTSKVTDMSYMFRSCSALTSLDVSGFKTTNVTSMKGMFSNCSALTSLDVSNFWISGRMTDMTQMFYYCEALETIYCANNTDWSRDIYNITSTDMFANCKKLSGKYLGDQFWFDSTDDRTYAKVYTGNDEAGGYFTYKGNVPSYELEVTEAGMATLYLGFRTKIPEGVDAYICYLGDLENDKPYATTHKVTGILPGQTGVFVIAEPGTYTFEYLYNSSPSSFYSYNPEFFEPNILTGTLYRMDDVPSHSVLTLGYGNKTGDLGFWWYTGGTIPAHRAYIPGTALESTTGDVKGITLVFDEETTSLTPNPSPQGEGSWYDLQGRKLEGKPTQKGLYINNGRKTLIK